MSFLSMSGEFTDAKIIRLEQANNGTVFIDEIEVVPTPDETAHFLENEGFQTGRGCEPL
jgi:DNA-binding NtrC family response regulator